RIVYRTKLLRIATKDGVVPIGPGGDTLQTKMFCSGHYQIYPTEIIGITRKRDVVRSAHPVAKSGIGELIREHSREIDRYPVVQVKIRLTMREGPRCIVDSPSMTHGLVGINWHWWPSPSAWYLGKAGERFGIGRTLHPFELMPKITRRDQHRDQGC